MVQRSLTIIGIITLLMAQPVIAQGSGALSPPESELPPPQWTRGTEIQLMVTREINSRSSKAGDRFKLRVNAPVMVDGAIAIPVGAAAWGEVIAVSGTSAAGGRGHLSVKLLYVDTPTGQVALSGTQGAEGKGNTGGVVLGVLGFGILGLLNKGGNALFKAGDVITGYIADGVTKASAPLTIG